MHTNAGHTKVVYTSDKGPSKIGTPSLVRTLISQVHANTLVYYMTSECRDSLFTGDIVSLVWRFHGNSTNKWPL